MLFIHQVTGTYIHSYSPNVNIVSYMIVTVVVLAGCDGHSLPLDVLVVVHRPINQLMEGDFW